MDYSYLLNGALDLLLHDSRVEPDGWNIVGYGIGEKIRGHLRTGIECLIIFVKEKRPEELLERRFVIRQRIPVKDTTDYSFNDIYQVEEEFESLNDFNSIPTDIQQVGDYPRFQAFTAQYRPLVGGCNIGYRDEIEGTLGCFVRSTYPGKGQYVYMLSAGHVLAPHHMRTSLSFTTPISSTNVIIQPSSYSPTPGTVGNPSDEVAKTYYANPLYYGIGGKNTVDAGIAQIDKGVEEVKYMVNRIGGITNSGTPGVGMVVKKFGTATEYTVGEIITVTGVFDMEDRTAPAGTPHVTMVDQIITTLMSAEGDSGAILVDENNKALGLLCGGNAVLSVFNKFSNVQNTPQISLF